MRKDWRTYFLDLADLVSSRSTCLRAHHGAVLTRENRILATGYNGSLPGQPHCEDIGCLIENGHCVRTVHAEANAVAQAARHGISLLESTLYVTGTPCRKCAQLLASAGVQETVFRKEYDNQERDSDTREYEVPTGKGAVCRCGVCRASRSGVSSVHTYGSLPPREQGVEDPGNAGVESGRLYVY